MGCRSFLTPYVDLEGKPKYYGRFNQGVVTINLVDVALSSGKNEQKTLVFARFFAISAAPYSEIWGSFGEVFPIPTP